MERDWAGGVYWSQTMDTLSDILRSLNFSSIGNEATAGRFSWMRGELMFYVRSATWIIVWEVNERRKGL